MNNIITPAENRQKEVKALLEKIISLYVNRKDIYEPLTTILPDHWNNILYTVIKKNVFKKVEVKLPREKTRYIWTINTTFSDLDKLAKRIIEDEKVLRTIIWKKNNWGNPYPPRQPIQFRSDSIGNGDLFSFKSKHQNKMAEYVSDPELREELLRQIHIYSLKAFVTGVKEGFDEGKKEVVNRLYDVYNILEYGVSETKKIIDES